VAQENQFPVTGRQGVDGRLIRSPAPGRQEIVGPREGLFSWIAPSALSGIPGSSRRAAGGPLPEMIDAPVRGDPVDPVENRYAGRSGAATGRLEEDLLGQVEDSS